MQYQQIFWAPFHKRGVWQVEEWGPERRGIQGRNPRPLSQKGDRWEDIKYVLSVGEHKVYFKIISLKLKNEQN